MEQRILLSASQTGYDSYAQALRLVGGAPQGGYCPQVDLSCAGLILCGGVDIEPHRYGQGFAGTEEVDAARDEAEFALARAFLAAGRPVLGVCRGHQLFSSAYVSSPNRKESYLVLHPPHPHHSLESRSRLYTSPLCYLGSVEKMHLYHVSLPFVQVCPYNSPSKQQWILLLSYIY